MFASQQHPAVETSSTGYWVFEGGAAVLQDRRSKLAESRTMMMSSAHAAAPDGLPAAPRAGADLRAARERLGWLPEEVAAGLRIRRSYIEALEQGRIDLLPGNAYALGFLRTYASSLGLEPEEMVRRFKSEAAEVTAKTELAFPAPVPERGWPAGAVVLLGLVLAVGAYAGWYRLSGEGRLPAETVAIPERLAPLAEQALPPAPEPPKQVAVATPAPAPAPDPAPPVPSISPTSAAAAPVLPQAATALASLGPSSAEAATRPPASLQPSTDQPRVVLHASADAWVQVRDKSGQILLNRILHAGDTWPVPPRPNLLLTTGNAGGTELVVDGSATGVLGNTGVVRRDLPLDPDLIKEGRLSPQPANGIQSASTRPPQ